MFKHYMLTAWMFGVEYYCPEYTYQCALSLAATATCDE